VVCERLNAINARYGLFKEIRGLGLLIGCVLNDEFAGKAKPSVTGGGRG
jgi:succinylornithine aminotransferase